MSDDHAPDDDLHIEIADTDGPGDGTGSQPSTLPPLQSPPTLRRVAVRVASLLVLVLVVGVLLRINSHSSPALATATPPLVPLGPVVLQSNVSYGHVTLNGRQLAGSPPLVATFRTGTNVLTLSAPPFLPQTCRLTWPDVQAQSGSCETDRSGQTYTINGRLVKSVLVVISEVTQDALPANLQASAQAAVTQAVSAIHPAATVPAGQYIATGRDRMGQITVQRSAAPLSAEILFQISTTEPDFHGGICSRYCTTWIDPATAPKLVGQIWAIDVVVASLQWRFTDSSEGTITSVAYSLGYPITLALTYGASGGWQVSPDATQALNGFPLSAGLAARVCDTGSEELAPHFPQSYDIAEVRYRDVEGCVLQVRASDGSNQGSFVWRFGVLLAADALAHRLAPTLPVAPLAEIAAVGG